MIERERYKKCKIRYTTEGLKRVIERGFPITDAKQLVLNGRWLPHIEDDKTTCVSRKDFKFWTIILGLRMRCHIFIVTVYSSKYREIQNFKHFKIK